MPTPLADLDVLPSATMNHGIVSDEKVDPLVSRTATGSLTKESLEGDVEGVEYPTDEEKATLPRVAGKIPWAAYTIAAVEFVERFSYYGSTVVFVRVDSPLALLDALLVRESSFRSSQRRFQAPHELARLR